MKPAVHHAPPEWFRHARGHRLLQPCDAREAVSEAGLLLLMDIHPLAGIGVTLAGSILAGSLWMAFMLWWALR